MLYKAFSVLRWLEMRKIMARPGIFSGMVQKGLHIIMMEARPGECSGALQKRQFCCCIEDVSVFSSDSPGMMFHCHWSTAGYRAERRGGLIDMSCVCTAS